MCKFLILFSALKHKFQHNFSQFIYRFKIGTFKSWNQTVLPSFFQFTKRLKIKIFECGSSWTSQFFPIMDKIENWDFGILIQNNASKFFPVHQFSSVHCSQFPNIHYITILWQVNCGKHCFQVRMRVFGTKPTCLLTPCFAQIFPNVMQYMQYVRFFYFGDRP